MLEIITPWCCVDKLCTQKTCVKLPGEARCSDCSHFPTCQHDISVTGTETICRWFPRRFEKKDVSPLLPYIRLESAAQHCTVPITDLPAAVLDWAENAEDTDTDLKLTLTLVRMRRAEFEALPEFEVT